MDDSYSKNTSKFIEYQGESETYHSLHKQTHPQPYHPKSFIFHNTSASYFPAIQLLEPPYFPKQESNQIQSIDNLIDHIEETLADQYRCRLVQRQLEDSNPSFVNKLFYKMLPDIDRYMRMPFGNYLCQKLLEHSSEKQLYAVISKITTSTIELSKNLHGTRVIQKLIDLSYNSPTLVLALSHSFIGHITELITVRVYLQ